MLTHPIIDQLKTLRLSGMAITLEEQAHGRQGSQLQGRPETQNTP